MTCLGCFYLYKLARRIYNMLLVKSMCSVCVYVNEFVSVSVWTGGGGVSLVINYTFSCVSVNSSTPFFLREPYVNACACFQKN